MTTFLQDGATWLNQQLQQSAGRTATYSRAANTVSGTATVAQRLYGITDDSGFPLSVTSFDVIWERTTLILDTVQITPRTGDVINIATINETLTLEVMPVGKLPCCQWLDDDGQMVLIHTKRVA